MPVANPEIRSVRDLPGWERTMLLSGMRSPRLRQISPGTKLYRVADRARSQCDDGSQADPEAGGWWFGQKAFHQIMRDCIELDTTKGGLGWSARRALAVLFGWNACDLLVEAYVRKPVKIFKGKGHTQREQAPIGNVTFTGRDNIEQWYIPSITEREPLSGGRTRTRLSSFGQSVPISSYQWYKPLES